jgi:hypothetical protein
VGQGLLTLLFFKHVSTSLFIKLVNSDKCVVLWLLIGKRCAEETACRKKEAEEEKS